MFCTRHPVNVSGWRLMARDVWHCSHLLLSESVSLVVPVRRIRLGNNRVGDGGATALASVLPLSVGLLSLE